MAPEIERLPGKFVKGKWHDDIFLWKGKEYYSWDELREGMTEYALSTINSFDNGNGFSKGDGVQGPNAPRDPHRFDFLGSPGPLVYNEKKIEKEDNKVSWTNKLLSRFYWWRPTTEKLE